MCDPCVSICCLHWSTKHTMIAKITKNLKWAVGGQRANRVLAIFVFCTTAPPTTQTNKQKSEIDTRLSRDHD